MVSQSSRTVPGFLRAALVAASAALMVTCGGGTPTPCPPQHLVCGSDGKLYCFTVPRRFTKLPPFCCATPQTPAVDAGAGATADGGDAGAAPPSSDAGSPASDGGATFADGGPARKAADAGSACGDGGQGDGGADDAGKRDAGPRPERDDAGVAFKFFCGIDLCHPQPDAGQAR